MMSRSLSVGGFKPLASAVALGRSDSRLHFSSGPPPLGTTADKWKHLDSQGSGLGGAEGGVA